MAKIDPKMDKAPTLNVIIQARMSSSRLPGKTLLPILGKTLLEYQLDSLRCASSVSKIIIATSDQPSDDPIASFCHSRNYHCVRGSLTDVAGRFVKALNEYPSPVFARFCADRPLYDWRLLEQAYQLYCSGEFDLVTNQLKSTFPKGQTTELIRTSAFLQSYPLMKSATDREHVTRYFYDHQAEFRIKNFESGIPQLEQLNFCVDTQADVARISNLMQRMKRPHVEYSLSDLLKLAEDGTECVE